MSKNFEGGIHPKERLSFERGHERQLRKVRARERRKLERIRRLVKAKDLQGLLEVCSRNTQ